MEFDLEYLYVEFKSQLYDDIKESEYWVHFLFEADGFPLKFKKIDFQMGIDNDKLTIITPHTLEDMYDCVITSLESNLFGCIIVLVKETGEYEEFRVPKDVITTILDMDMKKYLKK